MLLICISLLISHVGHLFTCLLASVCLPWENVCSEPLPFFFVWIVCVFVVELNESLYILDINSIQDIQLVKKPPAMQETWVRSLGWEDPPEKGKATHSSILAWRIP